MVLITDILQTAEQYGPISIGENPNNLFTNESVRMLLHIGREGQSFVVDAFANTEDLPNLPPIDAEPQTPFPCTVFEYTATTEYAIGVSRVAVVCFKDEDDPNVYGGILILPLPGTSLLFLDDALIELPVTIASFRIFHAAEDSGWRVDWNLTKVGGWVFDRDTKDWDKEDVTQTLAGLASPAFYALGMLQCANVSYEEVEREITRQERRRRERRKIKTARTYRIVVKIPGNKTIVIGERLKGGKSDRAFHAVRGHFSRYTEERKLFGKYAGTFWIPAHVRGAGEPSGAKGYVVVPGTTP